MKKSDIYSAATRTLQCIVAILTVAQHGACLQLGMQQQVATGDSSAIIASNQQQQQVQSVQVLMGSAEGEPGKQQEAPKSNHRLVSKLKDARHRRRNRHHRHRHHHHLGEKSAPLVEQHGSTTLTALESIVEEVARAGQLPAASNQQQQQQQQQQPAQAQTPMNTASSTAVASNSDLMLDGSSSPMTHLQHVPSQQTHSIPTINQPLPIPTRSPPYNSRGFFLTSMLSKIMNVLNVTEFALEMRDGISSRASCMACNAVVGLFLSPLYSKEVFSAAIRTVCTSFKIQSSRVCAGLVESFQDDFEYIRKNTKLTRDEVCAVVFGVDCARRQTYNLFWTVPIPEMPSKSESLSVPISEHSLTNLEDAPDLFEYRKSNSVSSGGTNNNKDNHASASSTAKPTDGDPRASSQEKSGPTEAQTSFALNKNSKVLKRQQYIFDDEQLDSNEPGGSERGSKISSFVHITDIHIDPYYEPGSLNDCNEPLCCRSTSGPVPLGEKRRQAGRWGDYGNCDTPIRTLRSALNRIREQHSNVSRFSHEG